MDKKTLESEYRRFLKIAEKWRALLIKYQVYHDTSATGEPFRYVGLLTDPKDLKLARKYVAEWQVFADLCKKYEESGEVLNVVESSFTPVPFIIEDKTKTTHINLLAATTSRLMTREQILKKYDSIIKKSKNSPVFASIIKPLMAEREFFFNEKEGELYRARKKGFTDTIIATAQDNTITLDRFRVGAHGALVFAHLPGTTIPIFNRVGEKRGETVYSGVNPVDCSPLGDFQLYRVRDLEYGQQTYVTQMNFLRSIESRNMKFAKRVEELKNDIEPGTEQLTLRKIEVASEALERLEKMDKEVIDIMLASGDNLTGLKLTDARKKYGSDIEKRYGQTFYKTQAAAKIR